MAPLDVACVSRRISSCRFSTRGAKTGCSRRLHLTLIWCCFVLISSSSKVAGVDDSIEDENGGVFVKDEDGHLTGQLFEEPAITRVLGRAPPLTISEMKIAVEEQWKDYASRGFTTVTDLAYMGNKALDSMLQDISVSESCPVRLAVYRIVHGPEQAASPGMRITKPKPTCCPRLVQAGMHMVGFYSLASLYRQPN